MDDTHFVTRAGEVSRLFYDINTYLPEEIQKERERRERQSTMDRREQAELEWLHAENTWRRDDPESVSLSDAGGIAVGIACVLLGVIGLLACYGAGHFLNLW